MELSKISKYKVMDIGKSTKSKLASSIGESTFLILWDPCERKITNEVWLLINELTWDTVRFYVNDELDELNYGYR